jgi:hypothetical protein
MIYNYKSDNFLYYDVDMIRLYDKNKILRYTINKPISYIYAQNTYIFIKHEGDNVIRLDFISVDDAALALDRIKRII